MIDPRLLQLSHSSQNTLHECPRAYQLYKLQSDGTEEEDIMGVTKQFGTSVGQAVQDSFVGKLSDNEIIWKMFLEWKIDLAARDDKRGKNFYLAVFAFQKFQAMREAGFLKEYELVYYNGSPAVELGFCILFPNGFRHRGFADIVLRNKLNGKILVVDCKTTWYKNLSSAAYKNSGQALGYSIVLDAIYPDLVSYEVMYLVYKTTDLAWEAFPFAKSYVERAQWIQSLIYDSENISRYAEGDFFPQYGENCRKFGRDCKYFQICGLKTSLITKKLTAAKELELQEELKKYHIIVSLDEVIEAQIKKTASPTA